MYRGVYRGACFLSCWLLFKLLVKWCSTSQPLIIMSENKS
ncbi:hypothetical protein HMPREF9248_1234 [Fannyhessea vaginae PB189-T1-4]|uniref:Uncharacterized protein n=1 Tax=Fannyhessea vaginae PB189-T1-4 TaxID=866774 RepID=A0ABP2J1V4_9ACTN|nr:hypothetical protein HMPREF9248_1234 [Fannyhessea vaginae PB189-T1-4]